MLISEVVSFSAVCYISLGFEKSYHCVGGNCCLWLFYFWQTVGFVALSKKQELI